MIQKDKNKVNEQFLYIDRWVDKSTFRAYVYGKNDMQKLSNSYDEYKKLIDSGDWFTEKKDVPFEVNDEPKVFKIRKSKDGNTDN